MSYQDNSSPDDYWADMDRKKEVREQQITQFIHLRAEGKSLRDCAQTLQIPLSTMGHWNKDKASDIQGLRMEAITTSYNLTLTDRLSCYKKVVDKITTALESQDFTQLHTRDLLAMLIHVFDKQSTELKDNFY